MATLRNLNVLDQMRLDVPHFKLIESAVRGDFDVAIGQIAAGGQPFVVRGLTISGTGRADALELVVADAIAVNFGATDSGSFLHIPATEPNQVLNGATNGKVNGAFVSGTTNYVGIDFLREADPDSADLVTFVDPITDVRTQSTVETAEHLTYRIVIGTTPFSALPNLVPIAKIYVSGATATTIEDARPMMFRLGAGGDFPSSETAYPWPQDRSTSTDFTGGDKAISSQKDWSDAIMTRIWEIGGGENWYTNTADRNVWSVNTEATFSNGDYWTFDSGTGNVEFKGVRFFFTGAGSGVYLNDVAGTTGSPFVLPDGYCVYVDLDRTSNTTVPYGTAPIESVGTGTIPGARWVMAWRSGSNLFTRNWRFPVGVTYTPATNLALGVVKLHAVAGTPLLPVVPVFQTGNVIELTYGTSSLTSPGFGFGLTPASSVAAGTGGDAAFFTGVSSDSGSGGRGLVTEGGSGSGALNRGGTGVRGIGGVGYLGAGEGVGVHGSSSGHLGVWGESDSGTGVSGTSTTGTGTSGSSTDGTGVSGGSVNATGTAGFSVDGTGTTGFSTNEVGVAGTGGLHGVTGTTTGAGNGVLGTASTAAGVKGTSTSGNGVEGTSTSSNGVQGSTGSASAGVSGVNTTGAGAGVAGTALGGTGHGVTGVATGTGAGVAGANSGGFGVNAVAGHSGVAPASEFRYTATKTGYIFVSVAEMTKLAGSSVLTAPSAPLNLPYYPITDPDGVTLTGVIRVPRGATLTNIDIHAYNSNAANYTCQSPLIESFDYNSASTVMNKTTLLVANPVTINGSASSPDRGFYFAGTCAATAVNSGSSAITNSGLVTLLWTIPDVTFVGTIHIAGLLVTYTYQTVDFMV